MIYPIFKENSYTLNSTLIHTFSNKALKYTKQMAYVYHEHVYFDVFF